MTTKFNAPDAPRGRRHSRLKHQAEETALSCAPVESGDTVGPEVKTAFDVFGSELPDEFFADVFNQPRERGWLEKDC
jgi:hypothetical protein